MKEYSVAVAGATGAVGQEMIRILEERNFPVGEIKLLASAKSAGKRVTFKRMAAQVEELKEDSFVGVDIALFSMGAELSRVHAPIAAKAGAVVIDNSSAFRMDREVPLVVPEVNPGDLDGHKGIIANPNCSTIQMLVALKPLYDRSRIKRIVVSTYQAVSGTGKEAIEELLDQSKRAILGEKNLQARIYPHRIAFNLLPQIDDFLESGYTKEEMKIINETRRIMGDDDIKITATCVRVPVLISHSESVNIETEEKIDAHEARSILRVAPGVEVVDDPGELAYPMPAMAAGKDATFVGRIREDESVENGLNLWIVSDNLRKGAALNAVQIAEAMMERGLI
ncbi:MAG: aspartate-semialdehyde dehydrogenase [Actinomycetota bacterium]|nr:aspartate-semialdehyde dehydrogenase [Actinomycetota bacterium]